MQISLKPDVNKALKSMSRLYTKQMPFAAASRLRKLNAILATV
ncbi:hypothetical protein OAJ77_08585 [Rhodospirillales bacterium]|nr:hypothetical protein [Rhodospirillales bacterium]